MPSKLWKFVRTATEIYVAGILLCTASSLKSAAVPGPDAAPFATRGARIFIKPKPGSSAALARIHSRQQTRLHREYTKFGGYQVIQLPRGMTVQEAIALFQKSGLVESAEADHPVPLAATPNDPDYLNGNQWSLNNFGQFGGVAGADIHAAAAWDTLATASNIVVAVVDTGVNLRHQDLVANLWNNPHEIAGNGLDDDGNGYVDDVHGINAQEHNGHCDDDYHHGTRVAGILGGHGNDGVGIAGVAWRVQIMSCRYTDSTGNGEWSDIVACLDYARQNGAKIINASFVDTGMPQIVYAAITNLRSAGIIIVAAAGNTGNSSMPDLDLNPLYPACANFDNIVSVAASTRFDQLAGFSSYGATNVDLAAPGAEIWSANIGGVATYTTDNGTSYSAPCVVGAVALMWARFPHFSYQQIIERLLSTTDPLPAFAGRCVSGGRLNLARALGPPWKSTMTVTDNVTHLHITGEAGLRYTLESSTTLSAWTPTAIQVMPVGGIQDISVSNSPAAASRFFRTKLGP